MYTTEDCIKTDKLGLEIFVFASLVGNYCIHISLKLFVWYVQKATLIQIKPDCKLLLRNKYAIEVNIVKYKFIIKFCA